MDLVATGVPPDQKSHSNLSPWSTALNVGEDTVHPAGKYSVIPTAEGAVPETTMFKVTVTVDPRAALEGRLLVTVTAAKTLGVKTRSNPIRIAL